MMKLNRTLSFSALTLGALILAGCGGSGSSATNLSPLKSQIVRSLEEGFSASSNVATGRGGASTRRKLEGEKFFDEEYQLWSVAAEGGRNLFLDEAATQAAGTVRTSTSVSEEGSFRTSSEVNITAGPLSGLQMRFAIESGATGIRLEMSSREPDGRTYEGAGLFTEAGGQYTITYTDAQNQPRRYSLTYASDGSSTVEFNSDSLFDYRLSFAADGSGSGTISGNNPLLPATIQWNAEGNGTLTFADGSTEAFENFDFLRF